MSFNFDGLNKLRQNAESLGRSKHKISLADLFSSEFLKANSSFESLDDFEAKMRKAGLAVPGEDQLEDPPLAWSAFIKNNTRFGSWKAMLAGATKVWVAGRLRA